MPKKEINMYEMFFSLMIFHSVVVAVSITSGFHNVGEIILHAFFAGAMLGFLTYFYIKGRHDYMKFVISPFYMIVFILLVIALAKVD